MIIIIIINIVSVSGGSISEVDRRALVGSCIVVMVVVVVCILLSLSLFI